MTNLLPIGTEFDNQQSGLRLRVVAHVKDQYGRMTEQVVPVGPMVKKTGRLMRKNAAVAHSFAFRGAKAPRSQPRRRRRKKSSYSRVFHPTAEPKGNPWPGIIWVAIILAALVALDHFRRKMPALPDLPDLPTYHHIRR
jgi:hypothetical protein